MKKWSVEKANNWYQQLPWIRGFCYYPSCCANRVEMWQEYGWENVKATIDRELKLASEWGFNAVRILGMLEVYIDQKESYLKHIDEFIEIADKYGLYVMFTFGNDCVLQKETYSWPQYGPQPYDFGYHSGKAKSPHITINKPGYNIIDEPQYEEKFYEMIKDIVGKYANDKRVLVWDIYNEPGHSMRGMMSYKYLVKAFEVARSFDPIQPCGACCWTYDKDLHVYDEIQLKALEMSDIILYHCYLGYDASVKIINYLKETYHRPLMNTEWLHRIWHNNIEDLFPLFRKEKVGCFNWGWVTGKSQTREPWEWLFDAYEQGQGKSWDFTKWQHDLVRANLKPYDFNEYEVIKRETSLADQEFESKSS